MLDSLPSDPTAGFFAAGAVIAALRYRHKTGKGQYIDLSEMESVGTLIGAEIMDYTMNRRLRAVEPTTTHQWRPTISTAAKGKISG